MRTVCAKVCTPKGIYEDGMEIEIEFIVISRLVCFTDISFIIITLAEIFFIIFLLLFQPRVREVCGKTGTSFFCFFSTCCSDGVTACIISLFQNIISASQKQLEGGQKLLPLTMYPKIFLWINRTQLIQEWMKIVLNSWLFFCETPEL